MNKARHKEVHPNGQVAPPKKMAKSADGLLSQPIVVLFLLAFLVTVAYSNTFSSSFHFDDGSNIGNNPRIRNLSNFKDFSGSRYIGFLSFALNYHFGELNVYGYHLVNVLIHIANGFLVYNLVLVLLRTPLMTSSKSNHIVRKLSWIALTTSLLFVIHPIQTQAVTYIVQRFTSLAALFYLLSVVCYLKWRCTEPQAIARPVWYAGALVATVLAMKTKEISFTLPFMILGVEGIFFRSSSWKRWVALIPFLLTLPIIPLSVPGALGEAEGGSAQEVVTATVAGVARETTEISRLDYLFTQFRVMVTYLRLLMFPIHQNLDYDYPIYHSIMEPEVLISVVLLGFLLGLAIYLLFHSRHRLVAFGLLWFFLTLSVESSIIPIRDVIFEHRLYLPSVGLMLAACAAGLEIVAVRRGTAIVILGGILTVLSVATYERNRIWKDEITLWTDVVQKSPDKPRGYNNLGMAYSNRNGLVEAIEAYRTALRLKPDYDKAWNNLGNSYQKLGRLQESIQAYKLALALNPEYAQAHYNLGVLYYGQEKLSEAIIEFEEVIRLEPKHVQAHFSLGNVYRDLGRLEEAVREYQIGSKSIP
jgi:Tfp pilus assembly protein PilF